MGKVKLLLGAVAISSVLFAADRVVLKKPPESLKKYYPPQSQKFEFLSNMYSMSTSFYAVNLNINEGDWDRALEWAEKLRDTYLKTAEMVPEWKDYFKRDLAEAFVKAVRSKNVDRVIEASKKLGQTCSRCHQDHQIAVKLVFHFPSFEEIKLEDPVEFMEVKTGEYMRKLSNSLKALKVYLEQGQIEKAQEAGINFVERARGLKAMCSKCHTEKISEEAILGEKYEEALAKLEEILSGDKPAKEEIYKHLTFLSSTCTKCHNVHLIPAMVQEAFAK
jgi:cytochrome c556